LKKLNALFLAILMVIGFSIPAESSSSNWDVYQKTLANYSGSNTALSSLQKSQIRATLDKTPQAEKFICTGIRYFDQPMSVNIMVRKRAKEACAYAKQLRPELSTWFQNKPTKARSYAGKVLLTVKSPLPTSAASPSSAEVCKVPDGRPSYLQGYPRGAFVRGQQVAGGVGFPFTEGRFPIKGEANILTAMVSFEDTEEFVDSPADFLEPQTQKITEWSQYWSQGKFQYNFQIVDNWIRLPMKSSEATSRDEILARMILDLFPADIDYSDVDGTFIYWAPGLNGTGHDFGLRVGSNEQPFVVGQKRPGLFWAPSQWHYEDTGGEMGLKYETKREYTWAYWIHELLHEQGLNLHAPGNGWSTGLGQNQYPSPGDGMAFSAAIPAWESFIMGWLDDSQIHCITPSDLGTEQTAVLTPLEISGGERKALVVPLDSTDEILVVESRRPTGYTENWGSDDKGLLVYRANPSISYQDDHSQGDCGNDPQFAKWSYYLFPDNETANPDTWCRNYKKAIVNEGESVSYGGVEITLSQSLSGADVVTVKTSSVTTVRELDSSRTLLSSSAFMQSNSNVNRRINKGNSHCQCCGCSPID
jgi:hypothetical protein